MLGACCQEVKRLLSEHIKFKSVGIEKVIRWIILYMFHDSTEFNKNTWNIEISGTFKSNLASKLSPSHHVPHLSVQYIQLLFSGLKTLIIFFSICPYPSLEYFSISC